MYYLIIKKTAYHPDLISQFAFGSDVIKTIEFLGLDKNEYIITRKTNHHVFSDAKYKAPNWATAGFIFATKKANYTCLGFNVNANSTKDISGERYFRCSKGNDKKSYTVVSMAYLQNEDTDGFTIDGHHILFGRWLLGLLDKEYKNITGYTYSDDAFAIQHKAYGIGIEDMAYINPELALNMLNNATGIQWSYSAPVLCKSKKDGTPKEPIKIEWVFTDETDVIPVVMRLTFDYKERARQHNELKKHYKQLPDYSVTCGWSLEIVKLQKPEKITVQFFLT